jgi:hypothetical protein
MDEANEWSPVELILDNPINRELDNLTTHCNSHHEHLVNYRFYLVVCFGSALSFIGIIFNIYLVFMFTTIPKYYNSPAFFLGFVSLFDLLLDVFYLFCMSCYVLAVFIESIHLYQLWHFYIRPTYMLMHVCKSASTFCLIATSQERLCTCCCYLFSFSILHRFYGASHWTFMGYSRTRRISMLTIAILLACVVRVPVFYELQVVDIYHNSSNSYNTCRSTISPNAHHSHNTASSLSKRIQSFTG